ncbi:MAG: HEPN domain-containing protein [Brevinematales bacterium]
MVNKALAKDYFKRAKIRFNVLQTYMKERDYADVIRESQEIVELIQKALLINMEIDPPKWHDVIDIIIENIEKIPVKFHSEIKNLVTSSKWLRREREISFYGDMDYLPLSDYSEDDAIKAIETAERFIKIAEGVFN